ncbi:MAG: class I tRNA ligase family protein, partial [Pseudomonadales bacterium]
LYEFIWNQYCDWYLELSKPVLWDDNASEARKKGTRRTLVRVLDAILRLSHPLIPYITEEIWQSVGPLAGQNGDTLMLAAYPLPDESKIDVQADGQIAWLKTLIIGIRNIRGEMNITPAKPIPVLLRGGSRPDRENLDLSHQLLAKLANTESIEWLEPGAKAPMSSTALAGDLEILVPMAGLIDVSAEIDRLEREITKLETEMSKISGKLSNDNFVQRAPEQVVTKERDRLGEVESAVTRLQKQVMELKAL